MAGELDALGRSTGLGYPHHTGHGIGYAGHEEPRIVPDSPTVLEPGMTLCLEPNGSFRGVGQVVAEETVALGDGGATLVSPPFPPTIPVVG